MLDSDALALLKNAHNLLAFSGGADSTALFHLLLEAGISFDIAHVNYHTRDHSNREAEAAHLLARKHGVECHLFDADIDGQNFEHEARLIRYGFFEALMEEHQYSNLITAHQLDDRLEWFLMQLSKGAGLPEMLGMQTIQQSEGYRLVRPLLRQSKQALITYLQDRGLSWFEDESNRDEKYKRNYFRHHFATPLLDAYPKGIAKSFDFLEEDATHLLEQISVDRVDELYYFPTSSSRRSTLYAIDKSLKQNGFLMRQGDKERLKSEECVVIGRRFIVTIGKCYTFIAPYLDIEMEKPFKEACRKLQIEPKLRPYLSTSEAAFSTVVSLVSSARP
ncbi:MAG: tRNA lysidine(34) synthetase TilS [Campylobacterota bacterium]|nr:tRNA lysidine(34) synthetase TilS [Campylobacterota bacterium]